MLAIRRPDVLLHGFLGLSLVEGEIVKGFDLALFWSGLDMGHSSSSNTLIGYYQQISTLVINVSSTG